MRSVRTELFLAIMCALSELVVVLIYQEGFVVDLAAEFVYIRYHFLDDLSSLSVSQSVS